MSEHTREPVRFNWTESGMEQSDGGHYVAYPTYCFSLQQRIAALESEVALLNSANEQQRWIIQRLNDAESIVSNELKASQQREGELRDAGEQFRCSLVEGAFAADIPDEIWIPFIEALQGREG